MFHWLGPTKFLLEIFHTLPTLQLASVLPSFHTHSSNSKLRGLHKQPLDSFPNCVCLGAPHQSPWCTLSIPFTFCLAIPLSMKSQCLSYFGKGRRPKQDCQVGKLTDGWTVRTPTFPSKRHCLICLAAPALGLPQWNRKGYIQRAARNDHLMCGHQRPIGFHIEALINTAYD